jgi:outer membrane protein TolC
MLEKSFRRKGLSALLAGTITMVAGVIPLCAAPLPMGLPEDQLPGLKQLLESAVHQSPTILSASLDLAEAEANVYVYRSGQLPSVSGSVQYSFNETAVSSNTDYTSKTDGVYYSLSVSQPIYHFGALKAQTDISKILVGLSERRYAEAYRLLALSIRSQYLALINKKAAVRNQRVTVKIAETQLAVLEAKLKDGSVSPGELNAPRLQVAEARVVAERISEEYAQARRTLGRIAGTSEIPDESVPLEIPKPVFAEDLAREFFEQNKGLEAQNTFEGQIYLGRVRKSELDYKIARVRLLPKFGLFASISQDNSTSAAENFVSQVAVTTTRYGVSASWTIFDGLATRGAKLSALAAKRLAERNLETYNTNLSEQTRMLEKQIGFSSRLLEITETRHALIRAALDRAAEDVRIGRASQSAVDTATLNANYAELNAMSARADFYSRWADYVSLVGADPALANLPPRYTRNGK